MSKPAAGHPPRKRAVYYLVGWRFTPIWVHLFPLLALALMWSSPAMTDEGGALRVGVLKFGTVNWELDVIRANDLDKQNDIGFQVVPLSSTNALAIALQGGGADVIVSDWIWVSRQRASGRRYTFVPYSLAVGGVIVRPDAGIDELVDLRGKRLGVAGGPVGKSWLLMRAYGKQVLGSDLTELVEPSFAAPPLLNELMLRGELPAVITFWHYGARLKAAGMKPLIGVAEVLRRLGIERPVPLLGWVFDEDWAARNQRALRGFLRASYAAKSLLARSDEEWERIRPLTRAANDAVLAALRDGYREGIPRRFGPPEIDAAARAFEILAMEGGRDLVGNSEALDPGTFWDGFVVSP